MAGSIKNGLFVEYCAKDFLDGTQTLDAWEELAYRRIVDMIYDTNDKLADDDRKLAWMTKTGSRWKRIKPALIEAGKIEVVDGRITNPRCRSELEKTARKIAQKSAAGIASAEARKSLKENETTTTAVPTAGQRQANVTTKLLNQGKEDNGTTVPNGTYVPGAEAPGDDLFADAAKDMNTATVIAMDPVKSLFDKGIEILSQANVPEREARKLIGQLRSAKGDAEAMAVLTGAARATDPVQYIHGARNRGQHDRPMARYGRDRLGMLTTGAAI